MFWQSLLCFLDCLISGGIPVILRSSGDGKTVEISSKAETDEKTKDEQTPEEAPSTNLDPGLTSPVTEVTSDAIKGAADTIKGAADAIKGAAEERGSVSSTTGSTRQMGHTTGQVSCYLN